MVEVQDYEKINLREGLPKQGAQEVLEELRRILFESENWKDKYFPPERQSKYLNNFKLFDRNVDGMLDYEELKEFLISIGQVIPDTDLDEYYKYLKQGQGETAADSGISLESST